MKHTKHWKYLKLSAIISWSLFLLFIIIINIGCTKEVIIIEEVIINRTVYINNTVIINNTIPCNQTEPEINTTIYNRDYVLSLIRQLKHYEKQQVKYWNVTECVDDLNRTSNELEECKEELCNEWNSSWC